MGRLRRLPLRPLGPLRLRCRLPLRRLPLRARSLSNGPRSCLPRSGPLLCCGACCCSRPPGRRPRRRRPGCRSTARRRPGCRSRCPATLTPRGRRRAGRAAACGPRRGSKQHQQCKCSRGNSQVEVDVRICRGHRFAQSGGTLVERQPPHPQERHAASDEEARPGRADQQCQMAPAGKCLRHRSHIAHSQEPCEGEQHGFLERDGCQHQHAEGGKERSDRCLSAPTHLAHGTNHP